MLELVVTEIVLEEVGPIIVSSMVKCEPVDPILTEVFPELVQEVPLVSTVFDESTLKPNWVSTQLTVADTTVSKKIPSMKVVITLFICLAVKN